MTDEPTDEQEAPSDDLVAAPEPEAPDEPSETGRTSGSWQEALRKRDARGRPMAVYAILGAGVATLVGLMLIVYFWSADRDRPEQPICTAIDTGQAQVAIVDGEVEQFTLVYSADSDAPATDDWGPVQARLDYMDGQCAYLPQGVQHRVDLFSVLGTITFYNQTTDGAQIGVEYHALADLDPVLFIAPTIPPEETPTVIETEIATPKPTTAPTATITSTMPPVADATPEATPSVETSPTEFALPTLPTGAQRTPTPTATP